MNELRAQIVKILLTQGRGAIWKADKIMELLRK